MKTHLLALGGAAALSFSHSATAQTNLFAVGQAPNTGTPSTFTINRTTGADTPVGQLGDAATLPFGLAVSGGVLYTFDGNTDQIRRINPLTGSYTGAPISIGIGNLNGEGDIAFGMGGVGYITTAGLGATSSTPALYSFNLGAGTSALVGTTSDALGPITVDGLAFNPANSLLYAITAEDDQLYTLNPSTGFLSPVGSLGMGNAPASGFGALTFDGGVLYGIINDALYTISTTTGAATPVGNGVDYGSVSGLAAAVPEPSAAAMLGLAGVMLLRRRQRA